MARRARNVTSATMWMDRCVNSKVQEPKLHIIPLSMAYPNLNQDRFGYFACLSPYLGFLLGFISTSRRCLNAAAAPPPTTTTNNLLLPPPPLPRSHYNNRPGRMGRTDGRRITAGQQPNATSYMLRPCYAQTHRRRNDDGDGQRSKERASQDYVRFQG